MINKSNNTDDKSRSTRTVILTVAIILLVTACAVFDGDEQVDLSVYSDIYEILMDDDEDSESIILDPGWSDAVSRAVNRYTESPDVETCSELAEWYVNGLEVVFEGELVGLIEGEFVGLSEEDPNLFDALDKAGQVLVKAHSALSGAMIESLKRNDSLCPRNKENPTEGMVIPDLKPATQRVSSLLKQRGASFSLQGSTNLNAAIAIAEGARSF